MNGIFSIISKSSPFVLSPSKDSREFSAACTGEPPVIDHKSAILDYLYPGLGEDFRCGIVAYAALKPNRMRFLSDNIFDMAVDVMGTAKDIDHIYVAGDVGESPIDLFTQDFSRIRVIYRHRNYLVADPLHIQRHVNGRLVGLRLGLDTENGDAFGVPDQGGDLI
jgi:hypothetical protein